MYTSSMNFYPSRRPLQPGQPKQCPKCHRWYPLTLDYYRPSKSQHRGFRAYCRPCDAKYEHSYSAKSLRQRNWADKLQALEYYGNLCVCCGESEPVFLTFDHIGGGGGEHRREEHLARKSIGTWLIRHRFPDGYRILCFNCHKAIDAGPKHLGGVCPHELKISETPS